MRRTLEIEEPPVTINPNEGKLITTSLILQSWIERTLGCKLQWYPKYYKHVISFPG